MQPQPHVCLQSAALAHTSSTSSNVTPVCALSTYYTSRGTPGTCHARALQLQRQCCPRTSLLTLLIPGFRRRLRPGLGLGSSAGAEAAEHGFATARLLRQPPAQGLVAAA